MPKRGWKPPMSNFEVKEAVTLRPFQRWHKSPLAYDCNYGYTMNYYQPMIDYLDAKDSGRKPPLPHLPSTEERAFPDYRASNPVHTYSRRDLQSFAADVHSSDQLKTAARSSTNTKVLRSFPLHKSHSSSGVSKEARQVQSEPKIQPFAICKAHSSTNLRDEMQHYCLNVEHKLLEKSLDKITKENERNERWAIKHGVSSDDMDIARCEVRMKERLNPPLLQVKDDLRVFHKRANKYLNEKSKQTSIEIEQLNMRVMEAETRLKTEVTRIKKKLHIQITELEMSLDVANKSNIELQKTIKKQSLSLTEIQAHYDEVHRQLQVTVDQYGIAQRKLQATTAELEEIRVNYETAMRGKRSVEQMYEDASTRISELTTINVNLSSTKSKLEQELSTIASDYDEVTKELRVADERYQRAQTELKHAVEILHDEQERIVKIESIKKSLEIEVKNLSIRLEEVETNALVGSKRAISKLEARVRDIELELDEEKRRHSETIKILRKKERTVKEVIMQSEEDQKAISLLQEAYDKVNVKVGLYKRQLTETEGMSQQSVTRVRRFQRELEAAEERADTAESNLNLIRAKHRTFVTSSTVPGSQVYLVQETVRSSSAEYN